MPLSAVELWEFILVWGITVSVRVGDCLVVTSLVIEHWWHKPVALGSITPALYFLWKTIYPVKLSQTESLLSVCAGASWVVTTLLVLVHGLARFMTQWHAVLYLTHLEELFSGESSEFCQVAILCCMVCFLGHCEEEGGCGGGWPFSSVEGTNVFHCWCQLCKSCVDLG